MLTNSTCWWQVALDDIETGGLAAVQDRIVYVLQASRTQSGNDIRQACAISGRPLTKHGPDDASSLRASMKQLWEPTCASHLRNLARATSGGLKAARQLLAAYAAAWRVRHPSAGLAALAGWGAPAVVRGGARLALLRPAPPALTAPQPGSHLANVAQAAGANPQHSTVLVVVRPVSSLLRTDHRCLTPGQ